MRVHPDARWWLTECRRLGRKYRWTRRILSNPRRLFWIEVLLPFFHWRLYLELLVVRPTGRLAMRAMAPYAESAARAVLVADEANRRAADAVQRAREATA